MQIDKKYKIVLAAKGKSDRFPNKNHLLLGITLDWLVKYGYIKNTVVISDSKKILGIAKKYGALTQMERESKHRSDLNAFSQVAAAFKAKHIIGLPITHPIRHKNIIERVLKHVGEYDFCTTYTNTSDRSIFMLDENNKFLVKNKRIVRIGRNCPIRRMIDGSIYCIKSTALANKKIQTPHALKYFWNLNFNAIENEAPITIDIDFKEDYEKFLLLTKQVKKVVM